MTIDDNVIERINELYRKSKAEGLTKEEAEEQAALRAGYVAAIRNNLRGTLNNVSVLNPDGTVTELKTKDNSKRTDLN